MVEIFVFVIGLCFGSFATLISWRLPLGEPVTITRSRCPKCTATLTVRDLFPVFSYIVNRGKCRHCGVPVHWRYPVIELVSGALFLVIFLRFGISVDTVLLSLFATCLLIMSVIDFEHYIIPNSLQWVMGVLGVAYQLYHGTVWVDILLAALTGLAVGAALKYGFLLICKKDGLGMGDVKFLFVAAIWLGVDMLAMLLFFSGLVGIVTAIIWRIFGYGKRFPFGPALAVSTLMLLVFPETNNVIKYIVSAVNVGY